MSCHLDVIGVTSPAARVLAGLVLIGAMAGCAGPQGKAGADAPGVAPGCGLTMASHLPLLSTADDTAMVVPAQVDGADLKLIIDTGAQGTVLSSAAVKGNEQSQDDTVLEGFGGKHGVNFAQIGKMRLGQIEGRTTAFTTELSPDFMKDGVAGFLGMDVLSSYDVDFNIAGGDLRLFTAPASCTQPLAYLPGPLYSVDLLPVRDDDHSPYFNVQVGDQTLIAELDTGSDATALSAEAARQLGLTAQVLRDDPTTEIEGVGRHIWQAKLHVLPSVTVGSLELRHVPVSILQNGMDSTVGLILGLDFAQKIHVWLSNSGRQLIMQYPPVPSLPIPDTK